MHSLEIIHKLNEEAVARCFACERPAVEVGPLHGVEIVSHTYVRQVDKYLVVDTRRHPEHLCTDCAVAGSEAVNVKIEASQGGDRQVHHRLVFPEGRAA